MELETKITVAQYAFTKQELSNAEDAGYNLKRALHSNFEDKLNRDMDESDMHYMRCHNLNYLALIDVMAMAPTFKFNSYDLVLLIKGMLFMPERKSNVTNFDTYLKRLESKIKYYLKTTKQTYGLTPTNCSYASATDLVSALKEAMQTGYSDDSWKLDIVNNTDTSRVTLMYYCGIKHLYD